MQIALDYDNINSFIFCGFTDKDSWIPESFPGYGYAHIFDDEYNEKRAYYAIMEVLKNYTD